MDTNARDAKAKAEERKGVLKFQVVSNDGKHEHLIMLATLKQIFSKQLPKMPRECITKRWRHGGTERGGEGERRGRAVNERRENISF